MKSFNNTMAEDNYNTSQSNLNAEQQRQAAQQQQQQQQQAQLRRQRQSNEQLAGPPRTTRIADEMSQDLQYLSRDAPLDGGESTFGAYSTLGHPQQQPQTDTTVVQQSAYKSTTMTTTTRTSSASPAGPDDGLLLDDQDDYEDQRRPLGNDYETTNFRLDGDDDATQVYDYNQQMGGGGGGGGSRAGGRDTQSPLEELQQQHQHQQQLEQLAPDNVDIQRPLQQAGFSEPINTTTTTTAPVLLGDASHNNDPPMEAVEAQLAEVSRVEIERGDLDNAALGVAEEDGPIQMVDLLGGGRTMPRDEQVAAAELSESHRQQRQRQQGPEQTTVLQQNLQVVNSLPLKPFLVSFMVDARGGAMRGCRHSGVRVIIPPNTAPQPMRITCRYLRRERLVHPPPLMEGEACASKIMEVGPAGARFLGPVLIEVPHFASLRGKEREIIILRSDSGEVWREHLFDTDEHLIDSIIQSAEMVEQQQQQQQSNDQQQENQRPPSAMGGSQTGGGGDGSNQQERRLTRIVTNEFPQYFAIISRIRQEVHTVGPEGLAVDSQVVPRVQAIFTDGALTKRIKIGLQKKNGTTGSPRATPEPHQMPLTGETPEEADNQQVADNRAGSPSTGGRPGSALQAKRKSRFLACFGASHGSHDLLNQSGTDAEGFASGSNSSSSGGDSPRQLAANERLVERRHIIEDLTDSEADSSSLVDDQGMVKKSKKAKVAAATRRSATGNNLVPEDYYIEQEPAFILNVRPKTYGKRLASSSAQTDQKLQANGYLSTSTKSRKRHGVSLLAKRRRNKTQMQIPSHEPAAQQHQQQQQQKSSQRFLRPKSTDLGATTTPADSSLESQHNVEDQHFSDHLRLDHRRDLDALMQTTGGEDDDLSSRKWRNCTIQTDSDSVTVQYVTISSLADGGAAAAAAATTTTTATTTGQDDGYVSGSGELKRQAAGADATSAKTHKGLFLPFCASSKVVEDVDELAQETDAKTLDSADGRAAARKQRKKTAAKEKKAKKTSGGSGGSGKSSPTKLDVVLEMKAEQKQESQDLLKEASTAPEAAAATEEHSRDGGGGAALLDDAAGAAAATSGGEEADESLLTTTTSRSISPTSKERKQQLKLEKQERLKREKLERQQKREAEETEAKALKAQKKAEKEAKKQAEKAEKLAKKAAAAATASEAKLSPGGSRAQSPELPAGPTDDESKAGEQRQTGGGVLGAITKTIQSVKFAPSPSKDSVQSPDEQGGTVGEKPVAADDAACESQADNSLVHLSIGADSNLLTEQLERDEQQLISFSSGGPPESLSGPPPVLDQTRAPLKPILKQQQSSSSLEEVAAAELKIADPKSLTSIADELLIEATDEAVQAADALQRAAQSPASGASSPTLTGSLSESKREVARRLKAEKDRIKAELKSSAGEEKRLMREAKQLAKQAEEAAKRAEREAKRAAQEAKQGAERQAEVAKREAEAALKLAAAEEQAATLGGAEQLSSLSEGVELSKSELKKRAKAAEAEAKKLAKAAEAEAKRQAKEAKAEAERLAKEERARLKAEAKKLKRQKSPGMSGDEPSAPSPDLVSSADEEQSSSAAAPAPAPEAPADEAQPEEQPEGDEKSVPIGLPRVSFNLGGKSEPATATEDEKPVVGEQVTSGDGGATIAEEQEEEAGKDEVVVSTSERTPVVEKQKKAKSKKQKKRKSIDKDAQSISSRDSKDEPSSAAEATTSKSSFLARLFKSKPKQPKQKTAEQEAAPVASSELISVGEKRPSEEEEEEEQVIVSEMYPSDPNNVDGEMILEVNVPEELISESKSRSQQVEPELEGRAASGATSVLASSTSHQLAEPTDDQEATLVNLSQMQDDVNDDDDDDEATENVLSQTTDFVESQADALPVQVVPVLEEPPVNEGQLVESGAVLEEVTAQGSSDVFEPPVSKTEVSEQEKAIPAPVAPETTGIDADAAAAAVAMSGASPTKDLAKDEKARKEMEAKLEKEAKKRAKEEERQRKKQEELDKKRAELEAKKQAKEEKERVKREAKEAKKLAELAKKEAKKNKNKKGGQKEQAATVGALASSSELQDSQDTRQQQQQQQQAAEQQPTTITTTTITSSTTTTGDDRTLNPTLADEADVARVLMSSTSETPINEETEVERIVEEVVGEDGTVTKTTKTIETKYVTMRQEEVRVAERRDMPLEEWERLQAERNAATDQQAGPSTSMGLMMDGEQAAAIKSAVVEYEPPLELVEIRTAPSYFDASQPLAEIKPDTSEKKAMRKRIKLNQRLIKRALKLAKSESKRAKRDQRRAEAEIAVCDEAARQARKELKCAVKEAKRAAKQTEKQHKKMDKIDKKLAKRAKELDKRQKKIDKRLAKIAKKQAKREAKAAAKAAKAAKALQRSGSSSSRSPSRSSKRSIKAEDIGAPVLRSSSRLSIVQNNPNVELSPRQEQFVDLPQDQLDGCVDDTSQAEVQNAVAGIAPPVGETDAMTQGQIEQLVRDGQHDVVHTITRETLVEHGDDGMPAERLQETQVLTGPEAEAAAMRMELEAAREEEEDGIMDVAGDGDEPVADLTRQESLEQDRENDEATANGTPSPETPSGGGGGAKKKNKKRNRKQKSKEVAE